LKGLRLEGLSFQGLERIGVLLGRLGSGRIDEFIFWHFLLFSGGG